MKLTTIRATGLKGGAFNHQLGKLTWVTGDNGSGKTSIRDAIQLAILGRHPALGATNPSTMQLSHADRMEVQLETDTGHKVTRRWIRKGKTIKADHEIEKPTADLLERIPDLVLDFDSFAKAKPTDRQRILETFIQVGDESEQREGIDRQLADLPERAREIYDDQRPETATFATVETAAKGAARDATQERKRLAGALEQNMVDQATIDIAANAPDKDRIKALRDQVSEANGKVGGAEQQHGYLIDKLQRAPSKPIIDKPTEKALQDAAAAVEEAERIELGIQTRSNQRIDAQANVEKIEYRLKSYPDPQPGQPTSGPVDSDDIEDAQETLDEARRQHAQIQHDAATQQNQLNALIYERDQLRAKPCCPTCGTAGEGFEAAIEELYDGKIAELEDSMKSTLRHLKQAEERATKARTVLEATKRDAAAWIEYERGEESKALRDQLSAAKEHLATLQGDEQASDLTAKRATLKAFEQAKHRWELYESAEIPTPDQVKGAQRNLEGACQKRDDLQAELNRLSDAEESYQAAKARMDSHKRFEGELKKATEAEKGLKQLAAWAKQQNLEATADAMRPLLDPANAIANQVVDGELAIDGTTIGIKRDDTLLPLEVLCGAEATVLGIGIQTAIASQGPLKIIMADELSRLTRERRQILAANLADAIERGTIDQAILFDHDADAILTLADTDHDTIINADERGQG